MKKLIIAILVTALLWTIMFCPLTAHWVNFWYMMTASAATLAIYATYVRPAWRKQVKCTTSELLLGIAIASALWGIFWVGDRLAAWMFDFARPQVDLIYGMKTGESPWLLGGLMLLLIGPAEEIFWRGYVQHTLSDYYNPDKGLIITTLLYILVHVASCNFMLIMAALVAGAVWGLCYRFFPNRFGAIILSHALWDVAVFVVFPI